MGLYKYRANKADEPDANGAVAWRTDWIGGPTLALIRNCPTPFGPRTVYSQGEPDTFFTIPAACEYRGRAMKGFLTCKDGNWEFHAYRDAASVYPVVE